MYLNTQQKLILFMFNYKINKKELADILDYSTNYFYAVLHGRRSLTAKMQRHIDKLFKEYNFDKYLEDIEKK